MDNMKRKLTFDESSGENPKKLRNEWNQLVTSIENLSNEIFYEIFEYLDGLHIYKAFSNLNYRFQEFVTCSSIRFKINIDHLTRKEMFLKNYKEIKHQIYSINFQLLKSDFLTLFTIDYSFNHLQAIAIEDIEKDKLISLLINLIDLPYLYTLNIKTIDLIEDLNNIYQLIFSLPKLKSNKLYLYQDECSISIPMSNNKQLSTIEYLHIAHGYKFHELSALISYTPELRHLNLSHTNKYDSNVEDILPINLNYLINISIYTNYLNFDEFQFFIEKINSKLKILHVASSYQDISFLHAYRWEKLISQNFPQLEKFSLHYREPGFGDEYPIYTGGQNQFISSFWIQRNWFLEIDTSEYNIHYYVRPYRNRWYKYMNSSIEHFQSPQLTIKYVYSDEPPDILLNHVKRVLNITQIYHLNIEQQISYERLMQIIHLLPDLITLKMNSLSFYRSMTFSNQVFPITSSLEHAKKIKYVYMEKIHTIEDIYFLMSFCPHMEYLNVECIKDMNIQSFLRDILNKINHQYLRLLCIYITTADDQMIKQLNKMIYDEKLLLDYAIHRELYNIYLKWK